MIWGLLFGLGWPTLTVLLGRRAYALFREYEGSDLDLDERAFIGAISLLLGVLWPVTGLWFLVTAKPPKTTAELKKEAKTQQRHIDEMERELGWDK